MPDSALTVAVASLETASRFETTSVQTTSAPHRLRNVERLVESVVASWHSAPLVLQSRRWHRIPFPQPLIVTPWDDRVERPQGPSLSVVGRDISAGGLCFCHDDPLPCRKVLVTFLRDEEPVESALVRLTWCRFTRQEVYQSGGRFLCAVENCATCDA